MSGKECSLCKEMKPFSDFRTMETKICKQCERVYYNKKLQERDLLTRHTLSDGTVCRICQKCGKVKSIEKYGYLRRDEGIKDTVCQECRNERRSKNHHDIRWFQVLEIIKKDFTDREFMAKDFKPYFPHNRTVTTHLYTLETMGQIYKLGHGLWRIGKKPTTDVPGSAKLERKVKNKEVVEEKTEESLPGIVEELQKLVSKYRNEIDNYTFYVNKDTVNFNINIQRK